MLNLSKSGHGDHETHSMDGDARSERSDEDEVNSTAASIRDDEENHQHNHHSDDNASDADDRVDKDDGEWIRGDRSARGEGGVGYTWSMDW